MVDRRTLRTWTYAAIALVGAIPIMFLPEIIFRPTPPAGDAGFTAVTVACMAAALAWASWFAIASFRQSEEFVQERSKFAWCWGSVTGIVIAVPIFALIGAGGLPWIASGREATHAFTLGAGLMLAAQLAGYFAMSAWWRATKR